MGANQYSGATLVHTGSHSVEYGALPTGPVEGGGSQHPSTACTRV